MKKLSLIVMMLMLCVMIVPQVVAQDDDLSDEDLELVEYVDDAFNKVLTFDSTFMSGIQTIEQVIVAGGQEVTQNIVQDMSGWLTFSDMAPEGIDLTLVQTLEQIVGLQVVTVDLSMDMRLVEEVLYVRVYDLAPELEAIFPDGWVNVNEDAASVPGFELINPEQMTSGATSGIMLPFNEATVITIEELNREMLEDDSEARVFEIELDPLALLEFEEMQAALGMFNDDQLGVDMESLMQDMMAGATYTVQAWVDAEEHVLRRVEVTLAVDTQIDMLGQSMDLAQTTFNNLTYSDFNEPVEIELPEILDF